MPLHRTLDGQSLRGYLDGQTVVTDRDTVYTELVSTSASIDEDAWAMSDGTVKYMYDNGDERCFDLSTDPGEFTDLYGTASAHTATCDTLAAARPCLNSLTDDCPVAGGGTGQVP